jgi:hypothetical protein
MNKVLSRERAEDDACQTEGSAAEVKANLSLPWGRHLPLTTVERKIIRAVTVCNFCQCCHQPGSPSLSEGTGSDRYWPDSGTIGDG